MGPFLQSPAGPGFRVSGYNPPVLDYQMGQKLKNDMEAGPCMGDQGFFMGTWAPEGPYGFLVGGRAENGGFRVESVGLGSRA